MAVSVPGPFTVKVVGLTVKLVTLSIPDTEQEVK